MKPTAVLSLVTLPHFSILLPQHGQDTYLSLGCPVSAPQEALAGVVCESLQLVWAERTWLEGRWARSGEYPSQCLWRRGQWVGRGLQPSHPFHATQQQHLYSMVTKGFPRNSWSNLLLSLQAVSSHLTAVPFQEFLSKPMFQHTTPLHTSRHMSQAGVHGAAAWTVRCRSYSVLPSTDQLLHSPLIPQSSLSVPADFPTAGGLSECRTSPLLSSPQGCWSPLISLFLFFFLLVLPGCVGIFLVLLGVQSPPIVFSRYSVRFVPLVDVFLMYL